MFLELTSEISERRRRAARQTGRMSRANATFQARFAQQWKYVPPHGSSSKAVNDEVPDGIDRRGTAGGADAGSGLYPAGPFAARVRGHEVAWGLDTGGQHDSTNK